jgi:mono/diheme cytochrome c family protein
MSADNASASRIFRRPWFVVRLAIGAIAMTAAARVAPAQPAATPTFTAEQVDRGRAVYGRNCTDCHGTTLDNGEFGGPVLKGGFFRQKWAAGGVGALYSFTKGLMPPDRPGGLTDQNYADLIAYILSNNGYTAGDKELPADPAAMQNMGIKP